MSKEISEEQVNQEVGSFYKLFFPKNWEKDLKFALGFLLKYGKSSKELIEYINGGLNLGGRSLREINVCEEAYYIVFSSILDDLGMDDWDFSLEVVGSGSKTRYKLDTNDLLSAIREMPLEKRREVLDNERIVSFLTDELRINVTGGIANG